MMEFWMYYRVIRKHYRTVLIAVLVALVVGTIAAWPRYQEYVASATLTTSSPDANRYTLVLVTDRTQAAPGPDTARVIELIQSRTVAERVIQRLNLRTTPQDLRTRVKVTGGRDASPLLTLSVQDPNPAQAVRLANTYAEVAVAYNQEVNRREATLARQYIEDKTQQTQTELTQAENALDAFKQGHGIVSMPTQMTAAVQHYLDLVSQQRTAEVDQRELSARIADIRVRLTQFSPTRTDQQFTENPIQQKLHSDLVSLEVQLAIARATYTEEHPTVVALKQKIEVLKTAMAGEIQKVLATEFVQVNPVYDGLIKQLIDLETQQVAVQAQLQALSTIVPQEQKKMPAMNTIDREYTRLSRNVQVLETEYTSLEGRLNDFRIQEEAAIDRNPVYIVDTATAAQPTSPSRTMVRILVAAMLGLVGGIGLVVFQSQIDDTLKTAKDAERLLGVPVLTSVPKHNPPFDEAYRLLKTVLGLHATNGKTKAIMFTSSRPGSGTSTIVYHLARAVARGGKRVTVVDADLRRPMAHRLFGVASQVGVVDVLTGAVSLGDAVQAAKIENVRVLPAGQSPASFAELPDLFGTYTMTQMLDKLRRQTDVILIDSPPAVPFAESRALASVVDGVVLVLAAGQAPRGVELDTKRQLERAHARVLGVVVNKVDPESDDGYYFHEKYSNPNAGRNLTVPAAAAGIVLLVVLITGGAIAGIGFLLFKVTPIAFGLIFHGGRIVSAWLSHIAPIVASAAGRSTHVAAEGLGSGARAVASGTGSGALTAAGTVGQAIQAAMAGAGMLVAGIGTAVEMAGRAIHMVVSGVAGVGQAVFAGVGTGIQTLVNGIGAGAQAVIPAVGQAIQAGAAGAGMLVAGIGTGVEMVGRAIHMVVSGVAGVGQAVFAGVGTGIQALVNGIGAGAQAVIPAVGQAIQAGAAGAGTLVAGIGTGVEMVGRAIHMVVSGVAGAGQT